MVNIKINILRCTVSKIYESKKDKVIPLQACVAQRVGRGIALLFHDRGTMSGQQHAPAALYPRERLGTHFTGGWVGLRAGLDRCGKSHPHRDSIPDRPASSQSLYRLSYPAHYMPYIYIYIYTHTHIRYMAKIVYNYKRINRKLCKTKGVIWYKKVQDQTSDTQIH